MITKIVATLITTITLVTSPSHVRIRTELENAGWKTSDTYIVVSKSSDLVEIHDTWITPKGEEAHLYMHN